MTSRRILGYDAGLVIAALLLLVGSVSLLMTAVTDVVTVDSSTGMKQLIFAVVGVLIAFGASRLPVSMWERYWGHAFMLAVLGVALVMLLGQEINGAKRWIPLGPIQAQPSEIGKVLVVMALAGFLGSRMRIIRESRVILVALLLGLVPAMFVFIQPDFGTAQVYGFVTLGVLFFAGARWTVFAGLGGAVVVMAVLVLGLLPAVGVTVLKEYQMDRLTGFLDPEADPRGTNYQTIQAKIAIGSGQLTGRPDGEASQVKQSFLPEPQTDFIFATLVEKHGFVAGAALLAIYMLLISRMLFAASVATSPYARLVAGGIATLFFVQVVINVGMVVGVLPVTGVPLPLFSYGGSALWANMAGIGLIAGIIRESETAGARYQKRIRQPIRAAYAGPMSSKRRRGASRLVR